MNHPDGICLLAIFIPTLPLCWSSHKFTSQEVQREGWAKFLAKNEWSYFLRLYYFKKAKGSTLRNVPSGIEDLQ
jgi:hypothetical protein